jgi:hypothetical protein
MNKNIKLAVSALLTFSFIIGISPANSSTPALLNQPWQGIKIIENIVEKVVEDKLNGKLSSVTQDIYGNKDQLKVIIREVMQDFFK